MSDRPPATSYLLHFVVPERHARHYLGTTTDLEQRRARHRAGTGARLTDVITAAGVAFSSSQRSHWS